MVMSTNNESSNQYIYQVSTLQALAMGYTKSVVKVEDLLEHGDTGLGTFEDVNGEMILLDGTSYRAKDDGSVVITPSDTGVPFAAATFLENGRTFSEGPFGSIDELKRYLDLKIEEDFGLNSMHVVRIDGEFEKVSARSEAPYRSHHISLKDILSGNQKEFFFGNVSGTLVCVYFPDYMDGINAPGWHLHFVSEDRSRGGHVFDVVMKSGTVNINKISQITIKLPESPAFDTYSLKQASQDEIKEVEQGKQRIDM